MRRLKKITLVPLHASELPTVALIKAIKLGNEVPRENFTSNDVTEAVPSLYSDVTEEVVVVDDESLGGVWFIDVEE